MSIRNPELYKDAFVPPSADYRRFDALDKIREDSESSKEGYKNLMPTIYDIKNDGVQRIIEQKHSDGVSMPAGALRGYQTYGVKYLLTARNALLTDSVGLGKTSQSAAVINLLSRLKEDQGLSKFRFIYLTEVGLVAQAQQELIKFTGKYIPTTTGDKKLVGEFTSWVSQNEEAFNGLVASYSAVTDSYDFMKWLADYTKRHGKLDLMIIDEGSVLSNSRTGVYKSFKLVRDQFTNFRVILNATPFEKDLMTMYNQLDFINPDTLPTKKVFEEMFVSRNYMTRNITGYKDPELFKKITRYLAFGQTRNELGVSVENSSCELVMYRMSAEQKHLLGNTQYAEYVFDDPSWLDFQLQVTEEVNPKLKALRHVLEQKVGKDKVMVYCKFKEAQATLLSYLESQGYRSLILNGDDNTPAKKTAKINKFNNEGYQVLITNLKKGLNLGHVNHLVFYSFSGNSGLMAQVEGRIIRSQSVLNKHLYLLMANQKEYYSLRDARENTLDRLAHTKEEVSLLNDFLAKNETLNDSIKSAKEGIKMNDIYCAGALYKNGMDSKSHYHYALVEEEKL